MDPEPEPVCGMAPIEPGLPCGIPACALPEPARPFTTHSLPLRSNTYCMFMPAPGALLPFAWKVHVGSGFILAERDGRDAHIHR